MTERNKGEANLAFPPFSATSQGTECQGLAVSNATESQEYQSLCDSTIGKTESELGYENCKCFGI
jgi:hypothetical protein